MFEEVVKLRPITQEGDIILYFRAPNLIDRGIDLFEWFEHHGDPTYFYHVAIAVGMADQIEAARRIRISPITPEDMCLVFRPPIRRTRVRIALGKLRKKLGQRYGYLLIIDDALRYISRGRLHLPEWLMDKYHHDDCSALVADYFDDAMWGPKLNHNVSPEDIYHLVKRFPVR